VKVPCSSSNFKAGYDVMGMGAIPITLREIIQLSRCDADLQPKGEQNPIWKTIHCCQRSEDFSGHLSNTKNRKVGKGGYGEIPG